jgi:hypothetical protein
MERGFLGFFGLEMFSYPVETNFGMSIYGKGGDVKNSFIIQLVK